MRLYSERKNNLRPFTLHVEYVNTKQDIRDFLWDTPYYLFEEAIRQSYTSIQRIHEIIDSITDTTALPTTREIIVEALLNACTDLKDEIDHTTIFHVELPNTPTTYAKNAVKPIIIR